MKTYLVTGGAGFIGANFLKYKLKQNREDKYIVLDKLTYAGNLGTIKEDFKDSRVSFIKGDICNKELIENIFMNHDIDTVVNFAAESHVDRSIEDPGIFLKTNILGTQILMDVAKQHWSIAKDDKGYPVYKDGKKFLQVSTDEVYGSLCREYPEGKELAVTNDQMKRILKDRESIPKVFGNEFFTEETPLDPRSPYATSKTGADMLVRAYDETYHFPVNVTRCSNNYGPYHFPEKLIPLIIKNILEGKKLPVYGDGKQVRDWLYVEDHCKGIDMVIDGGRLGEAYNIGGFNEETNINIVKMTIDTIKKLVTCDKEKIKDEYKGIVKCNIEDINYDLITYVQDRLGHDARYAIDPTKTVKELGFYPETPFIVGIEKTIKWYLDNQEWVNDVVSGDYAKYYENMYNK
ncbi:MULTISPECIES: dTDP-glucose 4,6-dehydratase [Psychrilyobacter]|uniref:NAD-dependent epimerase/dehydratase family protein n=1 Tax=Psychrilyobacter piezotolerans TaxID=2293438 RepID=A0ABX9KKX0_9FUSO|nr:MULTISPECIES: dTDP-glucose 4,6-dehydratase [Psychrilyobacter]MCS5420409.1 dTDP-glucose 4,6-dehydratase [Psychrilyobacter sp. S5]NDI76419.1 dTDP-glucose 4,6-dehydratase [Psychrilyobacter piezotolerans]RDE66015.1 dTDP-glucose 4,6-dehydratase [Psychrilyobacter sp. S5]REI43193.1 NAD-dependent epimerase/dehydratase family protein [Psychrilyobacter piezotolerans]